MLTNAAIHGKTDNLLGLKENVILGKLIPAGTGIKRYQNTPLDTDQDEDITILDQEEVEEDFSFELKE